MNTKLSTGLAAAALVIALLTATSVALAGREAAPLPAAVAPTMISYQGRVMVGGVPYDGAGYFKFAIIDLGGNSVWSNDGASSGGSEPAASVILPVSGGLFTVLLGNTALGGMSVPLTAGVFSSDTRYLRVWFSSTGSAFTLLSPDQRVVSVPYALQAVEAGNAQMLDNQPPSAYQLRVFMSCGVDGAIQAINPNGTVLCAPLRTFFYPLLQAQSVDLGAVDSGLKGFTGGFSDGRYAYFVPFYDGSGYSGKVARLDLQNFAAGGVTLLDLSLMDGGLKGFSGGFTDGRYGYFVPSYNGSGASGKVARVDLQNFTAGV